MRTLEWKTVSSEKKRISFRCVTASCNKGKSALPLSCRKGYLVFLFEQTSFGAILFDRFIDNRKQPCLEVKPALLSILLCLHIFSVPIITCYCCPLSRPHIRSFSSSTYLSFLHSAITTPMFFSLLSFHLTFYSFFICAKTEEIYSYWSDFEFTLWKIGIEDRQLELIR